MSLAIRMSSTGHLADLSSKDALSACLWAGKNRMCPALMRISVDMLVWPLIAEEVHGGSSHTGSTMTTRNGESICSDEASAWRTAFNISSGSYSGFAMHEAVHRYEKESMIDPKFISSGKAEQYVTPSVIEQLSGLPKSSVVVWNVCSIAVRRRGGIAQWMVNLSLRPCGLRDLALG